MARNVWDEPIDKNIPWDGNEDTNNLPVRGSRVEEFLKGSLNSKIGVLFYDTANNRYLAFADEEERDKYIADPTQTDLVLGTFDAPFNYTAEINLASKTYNAVFIGSSGHYIDFTFDVKNKQGASTGESVIIKYTFMRGSNKREVSEIKPFGSAVHFNIDKYLAEGTNTIIVSVTGQNTLAATSVAITYEVVNLQLNDMLDISKVYNLASGTAQLEVPYSISGYGTKIVEWYIDGEMLDYVRAEDEIVESNTTRTKHITLSNLSQGVHSLQLRAYTTVNGELFYTSTLYRDIIVYTGVKSDIIIAIATSIPSEYGIIGGDDKVALYDMVQYVPYTLRFATYSPSNTSNVEVKVKVDNSVKATINSNNGIENSAVIVPTTAGTKSVEITAGNTKYEIEADVAPTTMNIQEITNGLVIDFVASEKTNNSSDRDIWEYGDYSGTLTGFAWNNASGWVNNRLEMTAGSTFEINYAPLSNSPTALGKTIEIEWSTKNVKDDNAIICDLRNSNGVGIVIYATKVSMTSADGVTIETEYKSDENVRIAFVINRSTGSTYQRMSFIYANGILSRGDKWALTDSYTSDALLKFQATDDAEVSLKSIRIYNDALSSDNILNNYILYRDTVEEMMEVYDRNDVYEENRDVFSPSKMSSRLPVMIVTGDIPTLENTSDKDTQITVDIEYTNLQDPSRSFKMVGAAMRPQGTSSMGYPKKNFRIYTQKLDTTVVYDATGNVVADKLYSFKQGAQPVNCWCLKADYAESSGTHNTGIARLWNEALYNAQIDGEYKLRTEAQRIAAASGYEYDVRTTIDGFPILLFYRPSANDDVIFIGKYNFNNDKSTESVFGFKGIPNFDNSKMQCWEVLNNGNPLALFTTTENFDTMWSEAFESRYPDTKTPDITGLKAFAQWMSTVSQANFATEKWAHMDVYKMAAYWVYLMRHAGADQFVKNAMFTSEDGEHFYYILYDNDTINGLINTGHLTIRPTDTRQTVDASGSYVFAGHDSRLWNMLEADEEFINIVAKVDNALYSAGISYDNTIRIFDEEQADKWVEKVYNQDATYKYISPYVDKGVDNLFMLQGKRDLHRRWWLAKRFAIYDAKYVSGQYKSLSVELKCINGTPAGQEFTVTAGYPIDYGYGINNLPRKFGVPLEIGESYTFSTSEVVNLGDPIRIYGAPNIAELDLSKMADRLAVVTISNVYEKALGTRLTKLVVGSPTANNLQVNEISGLRQALMLDYLDVQGMQALTSLDLSAQLYFKTLRAHNSSIASVTFAKGAPVERVELPTTMRVLTFEQLPLLDGSNVVMEDMSNVQYINITNCPNISNDFKFINNWYKSKTADDKYCSLSIDNVNWNVPTASDFINLLSLKSYNALSLKGTVAIPNITIEQIYEIRDILGETVFNPDAELYIDVPTILQINSDTDTILDGSTLQFSTLVYPTIGGTYEWSVSGRNTSINNSGLLTVPETGLAASSVVVSCKFTSDEGEVLTASKTIGIIPRVYPSSVTISGNADPRVSPNYSWETTTVGVNGDIITEWTLSGNAATYWSVSNANSQTCTLTKKSAMPSNTTGTLTLVLKRRFDGSTIATATKSLSMTVTFPSNATINGETDPTRGNKTYTWSTTTTNVNGEYYAEWALSGGITTIVEIASQDANSCVMNVLTPSIELVSGTLTLTLKKSANGDTIVTATKTLEAMIEGVVITKNSNPGVQAALYNARLVANENYSLQEEVERITSDQLQPGTSYTTSIFYNQRTEIKNFDEFKYFTGVTEIKNYTFGLASSYSAYEISSITLPPTLTKLGDYAFAYSKLTNIVIPEGVTSMGIDCFRNCTKLTDITLPMSMSSFGNYVATYSAITRVHIQENYIEKYCKLFIQYNYQCIFQPGNNAMFYVDGEPITHLVIPESVSEIRNCNFANYGGTSVDLGSHNLSIWYGVFKNSNIKTIIGGSNTTISGNGNFNGVDDNIKLPNANFALLKHVYNERVKPFYYTSGSYYNPVDVNVGENTFTTISPWVFSDGSTSKRLTVTNTGVVQDYTNILKLGGAKITISSNKPESQFKIDYIDIDSGEDATMIVDGAGTHIIPMKTLSYTVTGITNYDGLISKPVTRTSSTCTCNYVEKADIYIQHIDGTLYTKDEWTAEGHTNDLANGIAVVGINHSFVIAPTALTTMKFGSNGPIEGLSNFNTSDAAGEDFDGRNNTTKIISSIGDGAAQYCNSYSFRNGIPGYLAAAGEMALIGNYLTEINEVRTKLGLATFSPSSSFSTSTVKEDTMIWLVTLSSSPNISPVKRDVSYGVIPLSPMIVETSNHVLTITADDVPGNYTRTTVQYEISMDAIDYYGNTIQVVQRGIAQSDPFPQNTSKTETVERVVTYTHMGITATTTIIHGVWVDAFYVIDLNGQWQESTTIPNPDVVLYDGVYESFSNKGTDNSGAVMYIDIFEYETFQLYIRSYAESNYDYVMVSQLDQTIDYNTSYSNTTLVKAHTRGNQKGGTSISNYTLVEFTGIGQGSHRITIVYRKDGSSSSGDDRGYVLIPKKQ